MPPEEILKRSIPWKVLTASPDMMDVTPGDGRFPFMWRSSLAISVFEPPESEDAPGPCGRRLSFVKVTCSITGYEPRSGESSAVTFDDEPMQELERLTSRYLGCYGALLNVAFFPLGAGPGQVVELAQLPHIMDFSPKNRELIRSITEGGEVLTGSSRDLKFDESRTTTEKNETTVGVEAGYEAAGVKATGNISHTWGTTQEDRRGTTRESGATRQEAERFSTSMDQMYSLLTGYHTGTNRATVLLLARPGTLQPTNRRTFVQGLRMLEGVQDFVFVVARPHDTEGLCVEAALDTGHFPEDSPLVEEEPETRSFTFNIRFHAQGAGGAVVPDNYRGQEIVIPSSPDHAFDLRLRMGGSDWVLDADRPGGWFEAGADRSRLINPAGGALGETDGVLTHEGYRDIPVSLRQLDEHSAEAFLTVTPLHARGVRIDRQHRLDTIVDRDFTIHARRRSAGAGDRPADTAHMLVTRRTLSACYRVEDGCPELAGTLQMPELAPSVFHEVETGLPRTGDLPVDRLYAGLQRGLASAAAADGRGEAPVPLGETTYFSRAVVQQLPMGERTVPARETVDAKRFGKDVVDRLGNMTVGQLLQMDDRTMARGLQLDPEATRQLRGTVLHHLENRLGGGTGGGAPSKGPGKRPRGNRPTPPPEVPGKGQGKGKGKGKG